ncbi:MAG TPA: hypothetical protein VGG75_05750 [Trebonia sp.]|jgi:hypothetical protein
MATESKTREQLEAEIAAMRQMLEAVAETVVIPGGVYGAKALGQRTMAFSIDAAVRGFLHNLDALGEFPGMPATLAANRVTYMREIAAAEIAGLKELSK